MTQIQVELIDSMGDDNSVVNAARVSFAKDASNYTGEENARLIRFLARERHELPFAHTAIALRVKAPIPQRTQCFKSKVGFVENEESRRYISTTPELFIPEFREAAKDKKQGSGGVSPDNDYWKSSYTHLAKECVREYEDMIAGGVAPEQARYILPQGVMVNWIWTGSLLAYARFYNLRSKTDAQKEIQIIADKVDKIMSVLYPVSWNALCKGGTQ